MRTLIHAGLLGLASSLGAETLTVEVVGSGVVTAPWIDCGVDCAHTYPRSAGVVLFATPELGSVFSGWACRSGAGACPPTTCTGGQPRCAVTMTGDAELTATFTKAPGCNALFSAPQSYTAGEGPASVAAGDLNRDGRMDLVVANSLRNTVAVLLGRDGGGFDPPIPYPVGSRPMAVVVADFTGDAILDIAAANQAFPSVSILRGTGSGFEPIAERPTGERGPSALAVADFDHDGSLDLVVANRDSDTVSILHGRPGPFGGPVFSSHRYAVGDGPVSVAVGDFNRDGRVDIATANSMSADVSVLLAQAAPLTFADAVSVDFGPAADVRSVVVADLSGDGRDDLAVAKAGPNAIAVRTGRGDGTFRAVVGYALGGDTPDAVAAADVDRDGLMDVVAAIAESNEIAVLRGHGLGRLQPPLRYSAGPDPVALAIADVDGAGGPDVVVASIGFNPGAGTTEVSVLSNVCGPACVRGFANGPETADDIQYGNVETGDFDGDGWPDLVIGGDREVRLRLATGPSTFDALRSFPAGAGWLKIVTGDFNEDGKLDLAALDAVRANVYVFRGNGDGTFRAPLPHAIGALPPLLEPSPAIQHLWLARGDVNRDGHLDIVVSRPGAIDVLIGLGNGWLGPRKEIAAPTRTTHLSLGDLDADGWLDLVLGQVGGIRIRRNVHPDRTWTGFDAGAVYDEMDAHQALSGDFNRDGRPDVAALDATLPAVFVLQERPEGGFDAHTYGLDHAGRMVAGDFDGDGRIDLAVAGSTPAGGRLSVLSGQSDGSFVAGPPSTVDGPVVTMAAADFNRDGRLDLAAGRLLAPLRVLMGSCAQATSCTTPTLTVNGSRLPIAVSPGATVTVGVGCGPGNPTDWVGRYVATDPNPLFDASWQYLNGTQVPPAVGQTTATLTFAMPATTGLYNFRFFRNNSSLDENLLATSPTVAVSSK